VTWPSREIWLFLKSRARQLSIHDFRELQRLPPFRCKILFATSVDLPMSQGCTRALAYAEEEADRSGSRHESENLHDSVPAVHRFLYTLTQPSEAAGDEGLDRVQEPQSTSRTPPGRNASACASGRGPENEPHK
jgi:hypothetical protein